MEQEAFRENRKAAMDAARRRLARLKLASVTASVMAMGGLTTVVSLQASAATAASTAVQVVSSAAQATAAQPTTTAAASPSPGATSAPAIVSAQS
jgi:hypothetical protein